VYFPSGPGAGRRATRYAATGAATDAAVKTIEME